MKRFKDFINDIFLGESKSEKEEIKIWEEIQGVYDVYQLMELLNFKYGVESFKEINKDLSEYEEDYNPDEFYELIMYRLQEIDKWQDFLENWEDYGIEKDENDPFHWRYRQKQMKKFDDLW